MSELAKVNTSLELPDFLRESDATAGFLADDAGLLSPPRFKILSGMSRQVKDDQGKDGEFWSDAHGLVIGGVTKRKPLEYTPVKFVPVLWQQSWCAFDGGTMAWQTQNADDPLFAEKGIPEDEKWKYKRLLLVMVAPLDRDDMQPQIGVFNFASTSYKVGRQMYRQARMKRAPLFAQVWNMGIAIGKNNDGEWYAPDPRFEGFVQDPQAFATFQRYAAEFEGQVIQAGEESSTNHEEDPPF